MQILKNNQNITSCNSLSQHIFLLSHMRANTSLIGHILGSHPQINGYYEMHRSYLSENDLIKQKDLYSNKHTIKSNSIYLFDKLLHNDYQLLFENLNSKKIKLLVSIRAAEQTIKSIINLFKNKQNGHEYAEPENAVNYYINRIKQIARFCESNQSNYYYFDAEIIRTSPEKVLNSMQHWLALSSPLSEQYQIFKLTGQAGAGDSSSNMKKGNIITKQTNYDNIEIPTQLLNKAITETQKHKLFIESHAIDSITL